ncbi:surf-like protein [Myotisia sp. PD_48]|nr:surf-like protein [Myotisia sp. PD_48]
MALPARWLRLKSIAGWERRPFPSRFQGTCLRCWKRQVRSAHTPAEDPSWSSIADNPAKLVRTGGKHGPGLIILALIPITAFALGTWQVQRLDWKSKLLAKLEDRLIKPPLPLPPALDPDAVPDFDYRRVQATGRLRHDQEMLIGPRTHEGKDGYLVVTPLEREGASTVLVNRGWIPRQLANHASRKEGLPEGEITVEGLLRMPWKKNMFTPDNKPEEGKFYFPDVKQMAELTGSQPIWIEETMVQELLEMYNREDKGIPIARAATVNLRNNHAQYIFTWYGLSLATAIMLVMVLRRKPNEAARRVRQNKSW